MLNKLIKYDFKWINKVMVVYFIVMLTLTFTVKIVESLEQTFLIVVLDKIVSGMFISCGISIMITCLMRIWGRFANNFYKDESYLTHTLPVTKSDLFNSKVISSILSLILSVLFIALCVLFVFINKDTIESLKIMYESLVNAYGSLTSIFFIIGMILLVLLEVIFMMMSGIFGIVIGYKSNNNKLLKSIIVGVVSYNFFSLMSLAIIKLLSIITNFDLVQEGFPTLRTLNILMLTFIFVYLAYNLLYYFVAKKVLNKGINVD